MGGGGGGKNGQASNTRGNEFAGPLFLLAAHFYIPLTNREWGHNREISDRGIAWSVHQGRGLRFRCSDWSDKVNKLFFLWPFHYGLRSNETINLSAENFKKHVTSVRCTFEPMIQPCHTGQRVPFWQLSIGHNIDVHYQVEHRLYMSWTLYSVASIAQSLQKNNAHLAANHSMCTIVAIY